MQLKKNKIEIVLYDQKEILTISEHKYPNNRTCIVLTCEQGLPYCKLTVNIVEKDNIKDNQFFIKESYPEKYIAEQLEKEGLIRKTKEIVSCTYYNHYASLWEVVEE